MIQIPQISTRSDPRFPYTTLFRSGVIVPGPDKSVQYLWFSGDPPQLVTGQPGGNDNARVNVEHIVAMQMVRISGRPLRVGRMNVECLKECFVHHLPVRWEIGRASCRERVCQYV